MILMLPLIALFVLTGLTTKHLTLRTYVRMGVVILAVALYFYMTFQY